MHSDHPSEINSVASADSDQQMNVDKFPTDEEDFDQKIDRKLKRITAELAERNGREKQKQKQKQEEEKNADDEDDDGDGDYDDGDDKERYDDKGESEDEDGAEVEGEQEDEDKEAVSHTILQSLCFIQLEFKVDEYRPSDGGSESDNVELPSRGQKRARISSHDADSEWVPATRVT